MKSLLPQAFAVSNVHPRPRKRLARCTLDCGSKTSESPALRGFVAGLRALATAALYLVLLSNGLPHPKIRLKKFGFSSKPIPTNIVKKLPSQRCFKPLLITLFNFSHKRPTFAFTSESGYTLGFRRRIAHSGLHAETGGISDGALSLPSTRTARSRTSPVRVPERRALPLLGLGRGYSQRTQRAFGTAMRLCASLSRGVAAPLGCVIFFHFCRNCDLYAIRACARWGWYHYPQRALRAVETPDGRLPKGLICRFLRLPSSTPCAVTFSANTQISLSAISVANTFALWYDKS